MRVTAVIVTYGDRFRLVNQVVNRIIEEGTSEIWIVDNDSLPNSRVQLKTLEKSDPKLRVFYNSENLGSSGAYHQILEFAYKLAEERIFWFLDDDNLPQKGALNALINAEKQLTIGEKSPVLYSYRGDSWPEDRKAVSEGMIKGPKINSFCGFHLSVFLKSKFSRKLGSDSASIKYPVIEVKWGPYGGLFTRMKNLKQIGLPDKNFFLYADDQEFTLRFVSEGIPQYLIYESQIQDLDQSIGSDGGYFSASTSAIKLFYGLRNTTYLSKKISDNPGIYNLNKIVFKLMMSLNAAKNYFRNPELVKERIRLFKLAFEDGEKGILGKTYPN
ncbi:glycosyltransferase [Algoriphagus antarcticus]|uniref:GT2 family glycosyltransferase n=1 Tax=Algoriphagus antarcticus TaxID=238540 RepID=A0A3E0E3F7_9BACT|nr:glycosyltransferase [Algoriphagus antarcticus]REG91486.1 GT2 family glycosyltransferase [Algoriphagus antarcticus]